MAQRHCHVLAASLVAASIALADIARAGPEDVVLLPTVTAARETPESPMVLRLPESTDGRDVLRWARRLDMTLREAVQDLGLTLDVSERPSASTPDLAEDALVERARESWVISPRLEPLEGKIRLRIVGVAPGSKVLLVRTQEVEPREVELRAMVMMRDLVLAGRGAATPEAERLGQTPAEPRVAEAARSAGRAVLALNSLSLGGYVGLSIQRSSGSTDPRLTYPLIALGTGIGLGGSMIVADEWDVGLGDAWYLSAGAWWPTAAGFLLADGYDVETEPKDERFLYGLVGASAGITLATVSLTFQGMSEGGALLAHTGGAFGMLLGALTELAIEEDATDFATPSRGMGYGAGAGVLVAGALATQVSVTPSRVLLIDLGAGLGALTAAAAASPLLLVDQETSEEGRSRAWFLGVATGTLIGGGLAWWVTRPTDTRQNPTPTTALSYVPFGGVIGESVAPGGRRQPVFGAGLRGTF